MITLFKPEHFVRSGAQDNWAGKAIAGNADKILNEWLEREGKVVYGLKCDYGWLWRDKAGIANDTHQAILIDIKPIEKKKCEHKKVESGAYSWQFNCKDCGRLVKATGWTEIEGEK